MTRIMFIRASLLTAAAGLAIAVTPVAAQNAPARWRPAPETITITAARPSKDFRGALTGTNIPEAFAVSASVPVPYSDLNLVRDSDATELDRRIGVAAEVVCNQLEIKYPRNLYVSLGEDNCEQVALKDGLSAANGVIAAARK